jgi:hypothetical protein
VAPTKTTRSPFAERCRDGDIPAYLCEGLPDADEDHPDPDDHDGDHRADQDDDNGGHHGRHHHHHDDDEDSEDD